MMVESVVNQANQSCKLTVPTKQSIQQQTATGDDNLKSKKKKKKRKIMQQYITQFKRCKRMKN